MELHCRTIQVLPTISGTSKSGNAFEKRSFVVETFDQFPRKVCFNIFNKSDIRTPNVGEELNVSFDIDSRSFQTKDGRELWSTDCNVWKIDVVPMGGVSPAAQPQPQAQPATSQNPTLTQQQMDAAAAAFFGQPQPQYTPQPQAEIDSLPF